MANFHLTADVVNFNNKHVKVNSLDQHPTESGHDEILNHSCYCYTNALEQSWRYSYLLGIQSNAVNCTDTEGQ